MELFLEISAGGAVFLELGVFVEDGGLVLVDSGEYVVVLVVKGGRKGIGLVYRANSC